MSVPTLLMGEWRAWNGSPCFLFSRREEKKKMSGENCAVKEKPHVNPSHLAPSNCWHALRENKSRRRAGVGGFVVFFLVASAICQLYSLVDEEEQEEEEEEEEKRERRGGGLGVIPGKHTHTRALSRLSGTFFMASKKKKKLRFRKLITWTKIQVNFRCFFFLTKVKWVKTTFLNSVEKKKGISFLLISSAVFEVSQII